VSRKCDFMRKSYISTTSVVDLHVT